MSKEKELLKVEYVPIESIETYANNAKVHTPEQIEQIKNSIEKFKMNDPIGIWHDTIVEGHGRYMACKELGYEEIPIIRLDHLTDKQRKAYIIAHNKITLNTHFDNEILGEELKTILDDFDMTDFGFGDFELTMLTEDFTPDPYEEQDVIDFTKDGEVGLAKKRVIITYDDDTKDRVEELLGIDEVKKVVYDISELS